MLDRRENLITRVAMVIDSHQRLGTMPFCACGWREGSKWLYNDHLATVIVNEIMPDGIYVDLNKVALEHVGGTDAHED
jgi:hypothetical protein